MSKTRLCLFVIVIFIAGSISYTLAATVSPLKGDVLPKINLLIPKNPDEKNYLGLSGTGTFRIPQIKAKIVIVEVFSMYCPHCQKDAPRINEMYQMIEDSPDLKNRIKIIGIGAGNSPFEVEVFKKTYSVPFPLFADKDFSIHKLLGEVRTPFFVVIKINEDGTHHIVHSQLGDFQGAHPFLELVMKASGLK
ncbi:MAG: redoxin domain-containing protein [Syntrophaceae bacterium]|nr:redoxin domain-containing protein [Syntrophaceae bacterium]